MTSSATQTGPGHRVVPIPLIGLVGAAVALLVSLILGLALGAAAVEPAQILRALTAFDGSVDHLVVRSQRLPRTIIAAVVGGALGVAGALMQAVTRNPLAAPGILGVNAGAAFMVVGAVFVIGTPSPVAATAFAFVGATVAAIGVVVLGTLSRGGTRAENLILAGAALTALLASLTTAVLIQSQGTLEEVRFWLAGSVAGRDLSLLVSAAPAFAVGLILAIALGRPLTALSLGDDVAVGLGQRTARVRALALVAVTLLSGASVSVAGPIGFVGLVVPNGVRLLVGSDYRWVVAYSALLGAALLVLADVAARLAVRPGELPVGVMTALVGGPVFVLLVRRMRSLT